MVSIKLGMVVLPCSGLSSVHVPPCEMHKPLIVTEYSIQLSHDRLLLKVSRFRSKNGVNLSFEAIIGFRNTKIFIGLHSSIILRTISIVLPEHHDILP